MEAPIVRGRRHVAEGGDTPEFAAGAGPGAGGDVAVYRLSALQAAS